MGHASLEKYDHKPLKPSFTTFLLFFFQGIYLTLIESGFAHCASTSGLRTVNVVAMVTAGGRRNDNNKPLDWRLGPA